MSLREVQEGQAQSLKPKTTEPVVQPTQQPVQQTTQQTTQKRTSTAIPSFKYGPAQDTAIQPTPVPKTSEQTYTEIFSNISTKETVVNQNISKLSDPTSYYSPSQNAVITGDPLALAGPGAEFHRKINQAEIQKQQATKTNIEDTRMQVDVMLNKGYLAKGTTEGYEFYKTNEMLQKEAVTAKEQKIEKLMGGNLQDKLVGAGLWISSGSSWEDPLSLKSSFQVATGDISGAMKTKGEALVDLGGSPADIAFKVATGPVVGVLTMPLIGAGGKALSEFGTGYLAAKGIGSAPLIVKGIEIGAGVGMGAFIAQDIASEFKTGDIITGVKDIAIGNKKGYAEFSSGMMQSDLPHAAAKGVTIGMMGIGGSMGANEVSSEFWSGKGASYFKTRNPNAANIRWGLPGELAGSDTMTSITDVYAKGGNKLGTISKMQEDIVFKEPKGKPEMYIDFPGSKPEIAERGGKIVSLGYNEVVGTEVTFRGEKLYEPVDFLKKVSLEENVGVHKGIPREISGKGIMGATGSHSPGGEVLGMETGNIDYDIYLARGLPKTELGAKILSLGEKSEYPFADTKYVTGTKDEIIRHELTHYVIDKNVGIGELHLQEEEVEGISSMTEYFSEKGNPVNMSKNLIYDFDKGWHPIREGDLKIIESTPLTNKKIITGMEAKGEPKGGKIDIYRELSIADYHKEFPLKPMEGSSLKFEPIKTDIKTGFKPEISKTTVKPSDNISASGSFTGLEFEPEKTLTQSEKKMLFDEIFGTPVFNKYPTTGRMIVPPMPPTVREKTMLDKKTGYGDIDTEFIDSVKFQGGELGTMQKGKQADDFSMDFQTDMDTDIDKIINVKGNTQIFRETPGEKNIVDIKPIQMTNNIIDTGDIFKSPPPPEPPGIPDEFFRKTPPVVPGFPSWSFTPSGDEDQSFGWLRKIQRERKHKISNPFKELEGFKF